MKLLWLLGLVFTVESTVVGIDYGTDWLKAAIIKPGGVLETVLNEESKRKTAAVVNIKGGVRTFGSSAVSLVIISILKRG